MIAFEENIKFQKKYFPDIYDSYESAGNEEAKAKVRSRLEILAPKYIYFYFGAKENKAMQKVLEDIFFLKNVDGSSFMIMRGMDDEVDYQNGVARLFHSYVGKSFNYYFSLELEEDKINNSYMVYIVDTDIERIDYLEKRKLSKAISLGRVKSVEVCNEELFEQIVVSYFYNKPMSEENKMNILFQNSNFTDTSMELQSYITNVLFDDKEDRTEMMCDIMQTILLHFEIDCERILESKMELGKLEKNFILIEEYLRQYRKNKNRFRNFLYGRLDSEIERIQKQYETKSDRKSEYLKSNVLKQLIETYKEMIQDFQTEEERLCNIIDMQ